MTLSVANVALLTESYRKLRRSSQGPHSVHSLCLSRTNLCSKLHGSFSDTKCNTTTLDVHNYHAPGTYH